MSSRQGNSQHLRYLVQHRLSKKCNGNLEMSSSQALSPTKLSIWHDNVNTSALSIFTLYNSSALFTIKTREKVLMWHVRGEWKCHILSPVQTACCSVPSRRRRPQTAHCPWWWRPGSWWTWHWCWQGYYWLALGSVSLTIEDGPRVLHSNIKFYISNLKYQTILWYV